MALVWLDTFDTYTSNAALPAPWTGVGNSPTATAQSHSSPNSAAVGNGGNSSSASRTLGSNVGPKWFADFWVWSNPTNSQSAGVQFFDTTAGDNGVRFRPAGVSPAVGQLFSAAGVVFTYPLTNSVWHHILLEVFQALAGTMKLTIDGSVAGTFSGDTRGSFGQAFINTVALIGATIGPSPPAEFYVDDLSMNSGTVPVKAGGFFHGPFSQVRFPSPTLIAAMAGTRAIMRNKATTRRGLLRSLGGG